MQSAIEAFNHSGHLIVDLPLGDALIEDIISSTRAAYPENIDRHMPHGTRLQDFWRECRAVKQLALLPAITALLEALYQRKPLPFQTLNFPVGTQQAMHADTLHFNSFPNNFMCGVWVALEDIDENNGPITYIPGSHRLPEYNMQDVGHGINHENYRHYEKYVADLISNKNLQPATAIMKKGQALIWHGNLLHGGSPHMDKERSRHSQVIHYYFEGCSYYTPMMSTPEDIHYRDPSWIKEHDDVVAGNTGLKGAWDRLFKPRAMPTEDQG